MPDRKSEIIGEPTFFLELREGSISTAELKTQILSHTTEILQNRSALRTFLEIIDAQNLELTVCTWEFLLRSSAYAENDPEAFKMLKKRFELCADSEHARKVLAAIDAYFEKRKSEEKKNQGRMRAERLYTGVRVLVGDRVA